MGCHDGHRERLKKRFIEQNGRGFAPHELLELLLFFSLARVNTNEIAHELYDRYGSIREIYNADLNDLMKVNGIGMNSATLIKVVAALSAVHDLEDFDLHKSFANFEDLSRYLVALFTGESKEVVYVLAFNNAMKLIRKELVGSGTVNAASLSTGEVAKVAMSCGAPYVLVAHNHPEGIAAPSGSDIDTTHRINFSLASLGIELIDHFIVAGNRCNPIMHGNKNGACSADRPSYVSDLRSPKAALEKDLETLFGEKMI